MNNVLITKLKGFADDKLQKEDEYFINVDTKGLQVKLLFMWNDMAEKHVRVEGGDLIVIEEDIREVGKHIRPVIKGKGKLFIPSKKTLVTLSVSGENTSADYVDGSLDISMFAGSPSLTSINIGGSAAHGNIDLLNNKSSLFALGMDRYKSRVYGDISQFVNLTFLSICGTEDLKGNIGLLTKLTELNLGKGGKITGNVSNLNLTIYRGDESGGNKLIWTNSTLTSARVSYRGLWINDVDLFLQNIASRPKSSNKSRIEVYGDNFTPASSDAIAKLIADGEVLTINGIVYNA